VFVIVRETEGNCEHDRTSSRGAGNGGGEAGVHEKKANFMMAPGEKEVTLKDLARKMAGFAADREWDQFHSPRNLLLALVRNSLPCPTSRPPSQSCSSTVLVPTVRVGSVADQNCISM